MPFGPYAAPLPLPGDGPLGDVALDVGRGERDPSSVLAACSGPSVGDAPLRRLSIPQYVRTVEDLLGMTPDVSGVPEDDTSHGYAVATGMSSLLLETYAESAHALAETAALGKLLECEVARGDDGCALRFIQRFSRAAFRRATDAAEHQQLFAVFAAGRAARDFEAGVRLVIEAVLQSPSFLYHIDRSAGVAVASGIERLAPYALANRLSYLLWGSMPDEQLLAAAAEGRLDTAEGLADEAWRMLTEQPGFGKRGFREFYRQWLPLGAIARMDRDPIRYPEFSRELASELAESLARQIDHVVWMLDGRVDTLLRGNAGFASARTAPLFGTSVTGSDFSLIALNPAERRGILTHPGLLGVLAKPNQSDPVLRGKFVRERLLCQTIAPPPPSVSLVPPDPAPGLTTRQRFAAHTASASCAGCHKLMDPIGFGLEHYDALGRYRSLDEGLPIDASGEIVGSAELGGRFDGALELADKLATSAQVTDCIATQYFRFALGRVERAADLCAVRGAQERFFAGGGNLRDLIYAVVSSDAFRYRIAPQEQPL